MKKNYIEIRNRHTSRRQFLIGTGSTLALPSLVSLMPRAARAQVLSKPIKRAVIYLGMSGIDEKQRYPSDPVGMSQVTGALHTAYAPLSQFRDGMSNLVAPEHADLFGKMNVYRGLSFSSGRYSGHNHSTLCGDHEEDPRGNTKSIDAILEKSRAVYDPSENIHLKALRVISGSHTEPFSFDRAEDGSIVPTAKLIGDRNVFNALFSGIEAPDSVNQEVTPRDRDRKLVIDRVYDDLVTLRSNSRLSRHDRELVEQYANGVFEVQKRVEANASTPLSCNVPLMELESNTSGNGVQWPWDDAWGIQNAGVAYRNIMDMIQLAFACDLTRVVFIGNQHWSDEPISYATDGGLHHECPTSEESCRRHRWGFDWMHYLAQKLNETPDPKNDSGTLLDNSCLLYTNELGSWNRLHNTNDMVAVQWGAAGGFFNTGYYVDYRQPEAQTVKTRRMGRPYKQLLQSILLGMGVQRDEYSQFGDENGFGIYRDYVTANEKTEQVFAEYTREHNDALPFVTNT